jgi:hypothetical protein
MSRRPLWILIAIAAVYRATLLGRGATAFVDETLYFASVMALEALAHGHLGAAATAVTLARGRQAAAIVQLPIAAMQALPAWFGTPASNLRSLLIPTTANIAVSLAILWLLHAICERVTRDRLAALAATAVYALLVNTNLYLRHVLPYDWSLLAGATATWIVVQRTPTPRRAIAVGLLLGTIVGLYVGYYLLAAVIAAATLGSAARDGLRRTIACAACLACGAAVVPVALEIVCRIGGVSYLSSSQVLSRSIYLGSFQEGWTFFPEYLARVEGVAGIVLISATLVAVARSAARAARLQLDAGDWLILCGAGGWMLEALLSAQWHVFVFYGRLIHPWMFVMALALASTLAAIPRNARRTVVAIVLVATIAWRVPSAVAFYRLSYPPDTLYALRIDTTRIAPARMICELTPGTSYASPGPLNRETRFPYSNATDYVLLNFCQGPPSGRVYADVPYRRIYDGPHWLTFPAYQYEGFTPKEREEMTAGNYRVEAYAGAPTQ